MTVEEVIEQLRHVDGSLELRFATSADDEVEIASTYEADGVLWVDLVLKVPR